MDKARVLLVDDEVEFVATLAERMKARGLAVEVAESGPAALERVRRGGFDAVVLDLAMPGMDGLETLQQLLRLDADLQVILLTGQATVRKGVEAIQRGAMDFLEKPLDLERLLKKIQEARSKKLLLLEQRKEEEIRNILERKGL
jgi:DNA-binding NtrC family response regulator